MKTIRNDKLKRIYFKDFWDGCSHITFFIKLLTKYGYEFEIVDTDPDIIFFSVFGEYYNCNFKRNIIDKNIKKCFYTGENKSIIKDANLNLTFQNTSKYNNIRLPLWILYGYDKKMQLVKKESEDFCCFVYSNNVKHRNAFCRKLSNYKKVDCGGGCLNNVGGKVKNKLEFQKKYKFCIAYENSVQPGYTTEKILQAYQSNCIPIYYGSETIKDDFNPKTFINAHDFDNNNDLINYIKKVDTDESLYNSYMNKPIFSKKWLDIFNDPEETYFKNIAQKIME
jgi:alpha(1,3/1,4) fucosyltransferase